MRFTLFKPIVLFGVVAHCQGLLPSCAKSCASRTDLAGCGSFTKENLPCFCENKDKYISQLLTCIIDSNVCSSSELVSLRNEISATCKL